MCFLIRGSTTFLIKFNGCAWWKQTQALFTHNQLILSEIWGLTQVHTHIVHTDVNTFVEQNWNLALHMNNTSPHLTSLSGAKLQQTLACPKNFTKKSHISNNFLNFQNSPFYQDSPSAMTSSTVTSVLPTWNDFPTNGAAAACDEWLDAWFGFFEKSFLMTLWDLWPAGNTYILIFISSTAWKKTERETEKMINLKHRKMLSLPMNDGKAKPDKTRQHHSLFPNNLPNKITPFTE